MKACKDCRHANDNKIPMCEHPDVGELLTDYYKGVKYVAHPSCQVARTIGRCGPEATLWEAVEVGFGEPE